MNLLADMTVQPGTLQPGLVAATASTDLTPPTSGVTSPAPGTSLTVGTEVTATGTATDSGGGVVGGVEVSVDGGVTWHPAEGRANWSYTWSPDTPGPANVLSRAVDDSGNLEIPTPPATLQSIAVTPASASITAGGTQAFSATGTYSDSSTQDLTAQVTWASGDPGGGHHCRHRRGDGGERVAPPPSPRRWMGSRATRRR